MNWFKKIYRQVERYLDETSVRRQISASHLQDVHREVSPNGKYLVKLSKYRRIHKTDCSLLEVINLAGRVIVSLPRDSPNQPYLIVQGHSDGHDYLVGIGARSGVVIIGLDHKHFHEFSSGRPHAPDSFFLSPSKNVIGVLGDGRGYPWEFAAIDFRNPKSARYSYEFPHIVQEAIDKGDGIVEIMYCVDVRASDLVPVDKLGYSEAKMALLKRDVKEVEMKESFSLESLL